MQDLFLCTTLVIFKILCKCSHLSVNGGIEKDLFLIAYLFINEIHKSSLEILTDLISGKAQNAKQANAGI